MLILSESSQIPQSQIFPFHFYRQEISDRWDIDIREISTATFEASPEDGPKNADIVAVQTWFDLTPERSDRLFGMIRSMNPNAKVIFLDCFAPTDLRLAGMLDRYVDLYVKKHVFRDRSRYGQATYGDTNLVEYYAKRYGIKCEEFKYEVSSGFLGKLVVGPSFLTSSNMLPTFFDSASLQPTLRTIDVHARLASTGVDWYRRMRKEGIDALDGIDARNVLIEPGVPFRKYISEMHRSRICFSPFGYGEVCWRDYESILSGALLVKPDMGHIETDPDIFSPFKTYIPVAWDFSDLKEKINFYSRNESERMRISEQAYSKLHKYAKNFDFVKKMEPLFRT